MSHCSPSPVPSHCRLSPDPRHPYALRCPSPGPRPPSHRLCNCCEGRGGSGESGGSGGRSCCYAIARARTEKGRRCGVGPEGTAGGGGVAGLAAHSHPCCPYPVPPMFLCCPPCSRAAPLSLCCPVLPMLCPFPCRVAPFSPYPAPFFLCSPVVPPVSCPVLPVLPHSARVLPRSARLCPTRAVRTHLCPTRAISSRSCPTRSVLPDLVLPVTPVRPVPYST
ncbi:unnamed protein product [Closterium sp. NIES-65]|nr:unnamed protein product [Closterium sp. NIES-65]